MSRKNLCFLGFLLAGYFIARLYIASISSFGFYHGWYEGFVASMARNYFTYSLWYKTAIIGDNGFHTMTPLYSYAVFGSFKFFGISDLSARVTSLFSEFIAIITLYMLSKELYGRRVACISVILFLFIPWNVLWFGRVNAEPLVTALMLGAVALYIYAYKHNRSMLSFGILFGLAVFTKQTALVIIPFTALWTYFNGVEKQKLKSAFISMLIGLIPLFIWTSYHIINGNIDFIKGLWINEFLYRSSPFSDFKNVILTAVAGLSPLIIILTIYEAAKMENKRKNVLFIWLVLYGTFVLVRTPPSHEYYLLPLTPVFAILSARGADRFAEWWAARFITSRFSKTRINTSIILIIVASTIPLSYAVLSYSGDLGYTSTGDAADYLNDYIHQHPQDTLLVLTPNKYEPQMAWYSNLTKPGYSNRQVYSISNDLSGVSVAELENIAGGSSSTAIFLVIDDRGGLIERIGNKYKLVYSSQYETNLPNVAGAYTGELQNSGRFGQKLLVFRLK